jgi:hypothetical protein
MRRFAIGGVTGVGLWLASALAAEAQATTIDPSGPTAVVAGDPSSTYTANVTASSTFRVRLRVYLNGSQKHDSTTQIDWLGGTYAFSKFVDMTYPSYWGHTTGDQLNYKGRAWLCSNPFIFDEENWYVTVSAPEGTFLVPDRDRIRERTGEDLV